MNETPATPDEDLELVAQAREGSRQAFNRLILKYQDRIVGLCVRLEGSYQDGQDAAQEAFVKAHRYLHLFRGESRFSTWLYRIATNTCRNRQRSWWRKLTKSAVPVEESAEDGGKALGDTSMIPSKDLERKRLNQALAHALRSLPAKGRELIVLRDIQGLSYEEIESVTGVALGTVKSRLARAREAMRAELKGVVDEP